VVTPKKRELSGGAGLGSLSSIALSIRVLRGRYAKVSEKLNYIQLGVWQFHENLCYHAAYETIRLQKRMLLGVKLGERLQKTVF
jgi:hypothetical protein